MFEVGFAQKNKMFLKIICNKNLHNSKFEPFSNIYWEQLEGIKKLLCRLNSNAAKELLIPAIIYIPFHNIGGNALLG